LEKAKREEIRRREEGQFFLQREESTEVIATFFLSSGSGSSGVTKGNEKENGTHILMKKNRFDAAEKKGLREGSSDEKKWGGYRAE